MRKPNLKIRLGLLKNISLSIVSILVFFSLLEFSLYIFESEKEVAFDCCDSMNFFPVCSKKDYKLYTNRYNIFVLGGSSVKMLEKQGYKLNQRIRENISEEHGNVIVKFAGIYGYGSARLFPYFESLIRCNKPNLIIFYLGNNEFEDQRIIEVITKKEGTFLHKINSFMSRFRFYDLYSRMVYRLGNIYAGYSISKKNSYTPKYPLSYPYYWGFLRTENEKDKIVYAFGKTLNKTVNLARERNISIILSTIPNNIQFPPAASLNFFNSQDLYEEHLMPGVGYWVTHKDSKEELINLLLKGLRHISEHNFKEARKIYVFLKRKIPQEDSFLEYYLGRYYLEQGKYGLAKFHFEKANDLDADPHHVYSSINEIIMKVVKDNNVALIDFYSVLENKSSNGIFGNDLFVDHVHLNKQGEQIWIDTFFEVIINQINEDLDSK